MARLAANAGAKIGLCTAADGLPNNWTPLVDAPSGRIVRMLQELGWQHYKVVKGLNVYRFLHDQGQYAVEVHPLWSVDHPELRAAMDELRVSDAGASIQVVNPFRLIHLGREGGIHFRARVRDIGIPALTVTVSAPPRKM